MQGLSEVSDADLPPPLSLDPSIDILPEGTLGETMQCSGPHAVVKMWLFPISSDSSNLVDVFDSLRDLRDWKKLGLFLGVPFPTLEKIELDKQGVDNRKMAMLHHWLCSGTANRQTLLEAMKKTGENLQGRVN